MLELAGIFTVPAVLARTGRVLLHLNQRSPLAGLVASAIHRFRVLAPPG